MLQAPWTIELLPVFVDAAGEIRRVFPAHGDPWWVNGRANASPQDVIRAALRVFGVGPFVTHSTSWRYDDERGILVLTYLLLLPTLHAAPPDGFEVGTVPRATLARGDLAAPPTDINAAQVMEHALRHLNWLAGDDQAIRSLLGPRWTDALSAYRPEPFRSLQDKVDLIG